MPKQEIMGAWRAFLRCCNAMPRPNTVKRWSNAKVVSVSLFLCLMLIALTRMERARRSFSAEDIVVDHRSLVSKRFEHFETGDVEAVKLMQQDRTTTAPIGVPSKTADEVVEDNLVTDSVPVLPATVAGPSGNRVFPPPKRSPANERVLPAELLGQHFPLEFYFHQYLPDQAPKSLPVKTIIKLDTKMPLKTVLVVLDSLKASSKKPMEDFFGSQRIQIDFAEALLLPVLVIKSLNVPRYSLIAFANYNVYLGLEKTQRSILDEYCRTYDVGILSFTDSSKIGDQELSKEYKLKMQHRVKLVKMRLNTEAKDLWRIAKPEMVFENPLPDDNSEWTIFMPDHESYQPLAFSTVAADWAGSTHNISKSEFGVTVAIRDRGNNLVKADLI